MGAGLVGLLLLRRTRLKLSALAREERTGLARVPNHDDEEEEEFEKVEHGHAGGREGAGREAEEQMLARSEAEERARMDAVSSSEEEEIGVALEGERQGEGEKDDPADEVAC